MRYGKYGNQEGEIDGISAVQLKNLLHIGVDVDQVATAQHFIELGQQAQKTWKRKNPKDVSIPNIEF